MKSGDETEEDGVRGKRDRRGGRYDIIVLELTREEV